jgi:hypothetical protein
MIMAVEHFDGIVIGAQGVHHHDSKQLNRHGQQAPAIADATGAAGANPTQAEYAALVAAFNQLLAAARGVGVIASS